MPCIAERAELISTVRDVQFLGLAFLGDVLTDYRKTCPTHRVFGHQGSNAPLESQLCARVCILPCPGFRGSCAIHYFRAGSPRELAGKLAKRSIPRDSSLPCRHSCYSNCSDTSPCCKNLTRKQGSWDPEELSSPLCDQLPEGCWSFRPRCPPRMPRNAIRRGW